MVFDTVKEDDANMPELLHSVYISKHVFNFVALNAKSLVPNWQTDNNKAQRTHQIYTQY